LNVLHLSASFHSPPLLDHLCYIPPFLRVSPHRLPLRLWFAGRAPFTRISCGISFLRFTLSLTPLPLSARSVLPLFPRFLDRCLLLSASLHAVSRVQELAFSRMRHGFCTFTFTGWHGFPLWFLTSSLRISHTGSSAISFALHHSPLDTLAVITHALGSSAFAHTSLDTPLLPLSSLYRSLTALWTLCARNLTLAGLRTHAAPLCAPLLVHLTHRSLRRLFGSTHLFCALSYRIVLQKESFSLHSAAAWFALRDAWCHVKVFSFYLSLTRFLCTILVAFASFVLHLSYLDTLKKES